MTAGRKGYVHWAGVCYGVDLQDDGLRAVRAVRSRSGVRCAEVSESEVARMGDEAICVGALSARESLMRWLTAPYRATDKAERVLPTLLDIQLPFALEDCVYGFLDVSSTPEGTTTALAVAARKSDLEKKLNMFGARGLDPVVLDHEGVALWSQSICERPVGPNSRTPRILVHLAGNRSTMVIGRGRRVLSVHGVKAGDVGQMIRLLHAQLGAYEPGSGDVEWVWSGPGAADDDAVSELCGRLSGERPGASFVHDDPELFLARALATRGLQAGPLRCNLRSGQFTHDTILRRSRRRSMTAAAALLVSGILLCCVGPAVNMIAGARLDATDREFRELAESMAPGRVKGAKGKHALGIVQAELEREAASLEPFLAAFEPSLGDLLVSVMKTGKRAGLRYEIVSLGREKVEIRGTSEDWNGPGELLTLLGLGEKSLERGNAGVDERIPFVITAERNR